MLRGTTLIILRCRISHKTPNRVFAYNGAYRVRLLMRCTLTEPTREPDHPAIQHRFAPTTGSLKRFLQVEFSVKVFTKKVKPIKAQTLVFVNKKTLSLTEKQLTFCAERAKLSVIFPKALTKTVRCVESAESRWLVRTDDFGVERPITSEPENRKITPSRLFP